MIPFLLNKLGDFFTIKIHYFTGCLSLSFFLIVQFWMIKKILGVHMLLRSILKGRYVFKKGVRWRIGTGESINLWANLWMPSFENTRLQSPLPESFIGTHVADLINPMTKQWDLSLLNNLFLPHEVSSIMSIPLCKNRVVDKIF